mgnify:CR=1 FL=1
MCTAALLLSGIEAGLDSDNTTEAYTVLVPTNDAVTAALPQVNLTLERILQGNGTNTEAFNKGVILGALIQYHILPQGAFTKQQLAGLSGLAPKLSYQYPAAGKVPIIAPGAASGHVTFEGANNSTATVIVPDIKGSASGTQSRRRGKDHSFIAHIVDGVLLPPAGVLANVTAKHAGAGNTTTPAATAVAPAADTTTPAAGNIVVATAPTAGNATAMHAGDATTPAAGNTSTPAAGNATTADAGNTTTPAGNATTPVADDTTTVCGGNATAVDAGNATTPTAGNATADAGITTTVAPVTPTAGNATAANGGNSTTSATGPATDLNATAADGGSTTTVAPVTPTSGNAAVAPGADGGNATTPTSGDATTAGAGNTTIPLNDRNAGAAGPVLSVQVWTFRGPQVQLWHPMRMFAQHCMCFCKRVVYFQLSAC